MKPSAQNKAWVEISKDEYSRARMGNQLAGAGQVPDALKTTIDSSVASREEAHAVLAGNIALFEHLPTFVDEDDVDGAKELRDATKATIASGITTLYGSELGQARVDQAS
jgi:hypothetical protein